MAGVSMNRSTASRVESAVGPGAEASGVSGAELSSVPGSGSSAALGGKKASDELVLDMHKLRAMYAAPRPQLDVGALVVAGADPEACRALDQLLSLAYLRRFLASCITLHGVLAEPQHRRSLTVLVVGFQALSSRVMRALVTRPDLGSWAMFARHAAAQADEQRRCALVRHLGALLLPVLCRAEVIEPGEQLLVARSTRCSLDDLIHGCALSTSRELPEVLRVTAADAGLVLYDEDGEPLAELAPNGRAADWRALPRLPEGGPVLLRRHSYFEAFFPRQAAKRASPIEFTASDDAFETFACCMHEGAGLIMQHWPEAYREIAGRVQLLAPLRPAREHNGLAPHNASVHGFRGLVTSSARPSYLAAQTLVHETGHNRFSSIYDTFKLFLNDEETCGYSPFVKQQRPLYALAHGVFAFLQDLHLSVRLLGKVPQVADLSLERYVDKLRVSIRVGLDNLNACAQLDARGRELTAGFERALSAVC